MLATLADLPFSSPEWLYEVKWDDYRSLAFLQSGKLELASRNNSSFTRKYYPITKELELLSMDAVLDGEIIVQDPDGKSNFNALQNWKIEADGDQVFYVFDILWLNGINLMTLPLIERKSLLQEVLPVGETIKLSDSFDAGIEFFNTCCEFDLEKVLAKKRNSIYRPSDRSKSWLKFKCTKVDEFVIGGYTHYCLVFMIMAYSSLLGKLA